MEFTAEQIASFLDGVVIGNPQASISDVSKIEEGKEGTISFLSNLKYEKYIYETQSSIVLVGKDFTPAKEVSTTLVKVDDAYAALAKLMDLYVQSLPQKTGIEQPSYIHDFATVGEDVYVGAFAYIGDNSTIADGVKIYPQTWIGDDVTIGKNTIIFAGAKIYPQSVIGENCIIHSGAVIGADGFGFAPNDKGGYDKLHQIGNVIIEDDVEIGANTTIDCATMGSTKILKGAKIDNQVMIAHNCQVGENTVIAAQTGVAGSSKIGANCTLAGQVGIAGHVNIGDKVILGAKAGISNDVKDGEILLGSPAFKLSDFRRSHLVFKKLPELYKDINAMKKQLKQ